SKYISHGQKLWQGAYVFSVTPQDGFSLKGTINHDEDDESGYYWSSPSSVRRSLYMDDVLYTISSRSIVMTDLKNIDNRINQVLLPYHGNGGIYPPIYR
ncbi:MAG TPA: beta-propeller domain-containing protein, partial [Methanomicrobiales archaeon]|nr:beta-propeller domain-containing protein [Methanomicrobiales archaeon]